ncbi:MAG TPA: YlxR family protein [Clostridiaceae bacterium]|nr:YlxR family protein [Clostridiaceae bacterium]
MKTRKVPMRRCVGCREMKEKRQLMRVVRNNEGQIFVDPTGKKNGRGAYICRNMDCFAKARKAKSLSHEFSCEIPEEVYDEIMKQLEGYVEK